MNKMRPLMLALSLTAFAPAAFAQDANDTSTTDAKRFAVVGGYAVQKVDSNPVNNSSMNLDGGSAPTLSASWYATPAMAVELWGAADKFEQRVRTDAGKQGNIDAQPMALSAQYHFLQSNAPIRPFVGLGYYETNYSGGYNVRNDAGQHIGFDNGKGAMGTVGVDFNISPSWFARADARYMHGKSDVTLDGQSSGEEAKLNPWVVGVGLGARF